VYVHSCTLAPAQKPVPGYETGMDPSGFSATGLNLRIHSCFSAAHHPSPDWFWLFTALPGDKK